MNAPTQRAEAPTEDTANIAQSPTCPICGRLLAGTWPNAQACRLALLMPFIEDHPRLSAAELAEVTGLPYKETAAALTKGRSLGAVLGEPEDKGDGTFRYRHVAADGWREIVDRAHAFVRAERRLACPDCGSIRLEREFAQVLG